MARLYPALRLSAVVIASPVIALYIAVHTIWHPFLSVRSSFHVQLRLWMNVMDWAHGIPVGYTYWERYEARALLDEIAVHHHEDSAS